MISNLATVHFSKRETCLKWLMISFTYFLLFGFIENPVTETISNIGKNHHYLFAVFCVLLPVAFLMNFMYTLKAYEIKSKPLTVLACFNLFFGLTGTTLMPKVGEDISTFATIAHWVFGFGTIIVDTVIALLLLRKVGKNMIASSREFYSGC